MKSVGFAVQIGQICAYMEVMSSDIRITMKTNKGEINATLFAKSNSWYMGSNVPGKPRRMLSYAGGVGTYRQACEEVKAKDYEGFSLA